MRFAPTPLAGAVVVDLDPIADERGFFARTFCHEEFVAHGLEPNLVQCSISFNTATGTLRGMHYQKAPHEEAKLVRCTAGALEDIIIDLRPDSSTYTRWCRVELTSANRRALYIPKGFAHGFLTLADNTEVFYQMSEMFHPECAAGVRWDDPAFRIEWISPIHVISERDTTYSDFCA